MLVHVRYSGNSTEYTGEELALSQTNSNEEVLQRVSGVLDVDQSSFKGYVVDRRPSGDIVVRPEAVYG